MELLMQRMVELFNQFPMLPLVFFLTMIATLKWRKHVPIFFCSVLALYIGFSVAIGGLHDVGALQAGIGWGILLLIPFSGVSFFAILIASIILNFTGARTK